MLFNTVRVFGDGLSAGVGGVVKCTLVAWIGSSTATAMALGAAETSRCVKTTHETRLRGKPREPLKRRAHAALAS
jgi:hypothetical protein